MDTSNASTWTEKKEFIGDARVFSTSFALNGRGYVATGTDDFFGTTRYRNLWEYDPIMNNWMDKASLPAGNERSKAVSFVINNKAYIATGYKPQNFFRDLWQYDPIDNIWIQMASLPQGFGRQDAVAFVLNNKGYISLGSDLLNFFNDLWQYDSESNAWTQKASLPASEKRFGATSFVINGKAYIVGGLSIDGMTVLNDVWEYDPIQDKWTEKNSLPTGTERKDAISFVIKGKVYLVGGASLIQDGNVFVNTTKDDILEYKPDIDQWKVINTLPVNVKRYVASSFSINNKAYIVGGFVSNGGFLSSVFEFIP